jgi:FdhD protein
MKTEVERFSIVQVGEQGTSRIEDSVVRELPLTIFLNKQELVTLFCSPTNLKYLVVGCLFSEGLIQGKGDIKKITVDDRRGVVRVETEEDKGRRIGSSGGRGASFSSAPGAKDRPKVESETKISPHEIFTLMDEFVQSSGLFMATGGVHSAALCDTKGMLLFRDDIGRHNAIDKIFGECILKNTPADDHIIITSGRISSEIVLKVARKNIPLLISKSAPTNLGVRLADDLGMTLVGFVRGKTMNVYTHSWRIVPDGK